METAVALFLIGVIAVTFLSGLATSSKAAFIVDERATAESLAQSQMEWAQHAGYIPNATDYSPSIPTGDDYVNYSANITAEPVHGTDVDIQKITVTVERLSSGEVIYTLESYKVHR